MYNFLEARFGGLYERPHSLEERMKSLEEEVHELREKISEISYKPSKTDSIYEKHKEELEKDYLGKIVAIDLDSETIVGIGNTILEAYKDARKKTDKAKFSFKKVGSPYLCMLR
jgi:predicted nuclease with TOPRIM domain